MTDARAKLGRIAAAALLAAALRLGSPAAASLLDRQGLGIPPGPLGEVAALIEDGRLEEADARLRVLQAALPTDAQVVLVVAELAARRGRVAEAEATLRSALETQPGTTALWRALGRLKALLGEAEGMAEAFGKAMTARPDEAANPLELAELWHERFGQAERAVPLYERALRLAPGDGWIRYRYGLALARSGRVADGLVALEEASRLAPRSPWPDHARGQLLADLGRPAEALAAYEEALRRDATAVETRTARAAVLLGQGRVANALAEFDQAVRMTPDFAPAWTGLGMASEQAGNIAAAVRAYREALARAPNDPVALNNLAWLLALGAGAAEEALDLARRAVALLPQDPAVATTLAQALAATGDAAGAEAAFDRAIALAPTAERHYRRALVRERRGDLAGTLADLDRALALDPHHGLARLARERLATAR